jgi:hypothetical protein
MVARTVFKRPEYIVREGLYNVITNFRKGQVSDDVTQFTMHMAASANYVSRVPQRPFFVQLDMPDSTDAEQMPTVVTDTISE